MIRYSQGILIVTLVLSLCFCHCTKDEPLVQLEETLCDTSVEGYVWYIIAHGQSNVNTPKISNEDTGVYIFLQDSFYNAKIEMVSSWAGKHLYEETGRPAYIVNVGKGGSSLNESGDLDWNVDSENELLDSLKEVHTKGFGKLNQSFEQINIVHLWIQGQGDDDTNANANRYQEEELEMLLDLRDHLGGSFPLAIYDVNRFLDVPENTTEKKTGEIINLAKMANAELLVNTWYINTVDPPVETSDGVHWSNDGGKEDAARRALVEMGKL